MTLHVRPKVLLHVRSYDFYDTTLSTELQGRHTCMRSAMCDYDFYLYLFIYLFIFCVFHISVTLKAPITTAPDDIYKYFFIVFQRK